MKVPSEGQPHLHEYGKNPEGEALRLWAIPVVTAAVSLMLPTVAHADFIWPAAMLAYGVSAWPSIVAGLLIEYFFLRLVFKMGAVRALFADVAMNAVSFGIGLLVWRLAYPPFTTNVMSSLEHLGDAALMSWMWADLAIVLFGAILISTSSELATLRFAFRIPYSWRAFRWLLAANAITALLAIVGAAATGSLGLRGR